MELFEETGSVHPTLKKIKYDFHALLCAILYTYSRVKSGRKFENHPQSKILQHFIFFFSSKENLPLIRPIRLYFVFSEDNGKKQDLIQMTMPL